MSSVTDFSPGPFREVQLLIDGMLAGVVFPYRQSTLFQRIHRSLTSISPAIIYSGEFLPSIWRYVPLLKYQYQTTLTIELLRPMLSYGAFDTPTYHIDITVFLPLLSDGRPHNFTINVVGMGVNRSINADWIISGNVQVCIMCYN